MSTSTEKFLSLKVGQSVLIETNAGELLVGTLKSINQKYFTVELDNVRDIKTNYIYQSSQILAYNQMKSVKLMVNKNEDKIESKNSDVESVSNITEKFKTCDISTTCPKVSTESLVENNSFNILLSPLDLQLLQNQVDSLTFITQTDHKYHKALKDIKSQSVIGFLIDPIETGRHCKTSLMAISTLQNIYIFDMLALGKVFKEIRLILEAERPYKALHFSHKIADHLKYRHNILLKGIFDTFLAYCLVANEKTHLTLEETIQKTFSMPNVYFEANSAGEIPGNSYQRPIPQGKRMVIGKKVAFQLKLYDHLLHDYMLKNFYTQCELFSQTFCNNSDNFQVGQQLHPRSHAGYEHIQPNGNWKEKLNINLKFLNNQDQNV